MVLYQDFFDNIQINFINQALSYIQYLDLNAPNLNLALGDWFAVYANLTNIRFDDVSIDSN